jgi:hypothetical protein
MRTLLMSHGHPSDVRWLTKDKQRRREDPVVAVWSREGTTKGRLSVICSQDALFTSLSLEDPENL